MKDMLSYRGEGLGLLLQPYRLIKALELSSLRIRFIF
jgi:hypothetical protein